MSDLVALSPLALTLAAQINDSWRIAVSSILKTGHLLIEAKNRLEHGEFGAMLDRELPFSHSMAQRLMAIARDQRIAAIDSSHLPNSWSTLYELTKLDDAELLEAKQQNIVRPDITRWQVTQWRHARKNPSAAIEQQRWTPSLEIEDLRDCTIAQLRINARRLQTILDHAGFTSELATVGEVINDTKLAELWGR